MMNRTSLNFSRVNCAPINGAQLQAKKGGVTPTPTEYLKLDVGRLDISKLG